MMGIKIFKKLTLLKLQKRLLFKQKKVDIFLLSLILLLTVGLGVFNGLLLRFLLAEGKVSNLKLVFIVISGILFMLHGIFPGYKKMSMGLLHNIYPISNWEKTVLLFINENLTYKNVVFFIYVLSISFSSSGALQAIQYLALTITIISLNFFVRLLIAVKNPELSAILIVTIVATIGINATWYFFNLTIIPYSISWIGVVVFLKIISKEVNFNKNSSPKINIKNILVRRKTGFPFFENRGLSTMLSFTIISKVAFIVLFVLLFHKFVLGYNLFLLFLFSPLVWFNYIFNNLVGLHPPLYVNLLLTGVEIKDIIRKYILLMVKYILLDLFISLCLYTLLYHLPVGKFDLRHFSKLKLILFYLEISFTLIPAALLNSFTFLRDTRDGLFSKNTTSPIASLVSILIVLFFVFQFYTISLIFSVSCILVAIAGGVYAYHKALNTIVVKKVKVLETLTKK